MASMRVHELAKEFDMSSKELLDKLQQMKIPAKSHASMLADAYVDKIRKNLEPEIKQRAGQLEDEEARKLAEERAEAERTVAQARPSVEALEQKLAALKQELESAAARYEEAQEAVVPLRKEAARLRDDAEALNRKNTDKYLVFAPELLNDGEEVLGIGNVVNLPNGWFDTFIYLHLENTGTAYTLRVNDRTVAVVEDPFAPADFDLTPYVKQGDNLILLELHESNTPELQKGFTPTPVKPFTNSYLFAQEKRSIRDFNVALIPDSTRKFGVLDLEVIVQNGYNYEEPITVGFDIYAPNGKLLDFSVNDITVPGRSLDTVRFSPYIYHTYENSWGAKGAAPLYRVMLYTKRKGVFKEYIPLKVGFGKTEMKDGKITRFDKPVTIVSERYNAAADAAATRKELLALKKKGINTIWPNAPQPYWFYNLCDELGLFVIDQANINAPEKRDDRTTGGTPSNDPRLADEYLERVRNMYYRSRNHTCIIGFALGGESGNGYNMYKAYQWLKSVEPSRPVICIDADGEWNTDLEIVP